MLPALDSARRALQQLTLQALSRQVNAELLRAVGCKLADHARPLTGRCGGLAACSPAQWHIAELLSKGQQVC